MSFWSDLYVAPPALVAEALATAEARNVADPLADQPFILAQVTLPGVVPDGTGELANSPDFLTQLACEVAGVQPFSFAASISQILEGESDLSAAADGTYVMSNRWVQLLAGLSTEQIAELAERWLKELDPGAAELPAEVASQAALLQSIAAVCRVALERDTAVLYRWTM